MNAVELALERERLAAEIAENREERLAQIDAELARRSKDAAAQRAENRRAYQEIEARYLESRQAAWDATRKFVAAIERAALLRRELERLARRDGARVADDGQVEQMPDPVYVTAERDPKLRELRSLARSAASIARW